MKKTYYIGVMSGTSLDGVDVALCQIGETQCELAAYHTYPFPPSLKTEILRLTRTAVTLSEIGRTDHRLGVLFADAINRLMEDAPIGPEAVAAIGSHGQTVWHAPAGEEPFTLQLGDPNLITVRTGIPVVADFRRKDMACGGGGAPFAPAFHQFIFKNIETGAAVANIGGIANITILGEPLSGYDTGPGNMLMDSWIEKHQKLPYDREGRWAGEGKMLPAVLEKMMAEPYFSYASPKSTGRERFNLAWIEKILSGMEESFRPEDVQRTLLELTALSLSREVSKHRLRLLMLCGGGAKNSFLAARIAALLPEVRVEVMAEAESLEAMMMAWLAYKRLHREAVNLKSVTGAHCNTVLGALYQ